MGLVSLDGSLPTDDQADRLLPEDERAQVRAEEEASQERVEFCRTPDQAEALVAKVPDVAVTYLAARPVELPQPGRWSACGRSSGPSRSSSPGPSPRPAGRGAVLA
jgi:hypothetical protein